MKVFDEFCVLEHDYIIIRLRSQEVKDLCIPFE